MHEVLSTNWVNRIAPKTAVPEGENWARIYPDLGQPVSGVPESSRNDLEAQKVRAKKTGCWRKGERERRGGGVGGGGGGREEGEREKKKRK